MSALTRAWLAPMAHHQARKAINDYLGEVSERATRSRTATQDMAFADFSENQHADLWARTAWRAFEQVDSGEFSTREAYVNAVLAAVMSADAEVAHPGPVRQEVLEQIPLLAGMPVPVVLKLALERVQRADEGSTLPKVLEVKHFTDGEWRGLIESADFDEVAGALEKRNQALASLAVSRELTATAQRYIVRVTWAP